MADVTLPSLGESVTEGIITRWFKQVGDAVARDEPLFEVSTDKVDSEMPSPAAGVLVQILAAEGDTVETGARVAVIDENATAAATPKDGPAVTPPAATPVAPAAPARVSTSSSPGVVVSPVVRRILADGLVEISTVHGTGPSGTITRRDAELAVAQGPTEDIVVAISNGQRRMGQHMSASVLSTPHGFVAVDIDVCVIDVAESAGRRTSDGALVTDEVLFTVAAVRALAEFPFLNATWANEQLTMHRTINVGLQRHVAGDAMLVPVVHAATGLSLAAMARRVGDLDERRGQRQLTTDDLMGGTFTISRAPSLHTLFAQPIIIQPQVAALSLGAVRREAVVVDDDGGYRVGVGRRVALGLSFDHRVCDATVAAAFLERVGEIINHLDLSMDL